jgi:hypothetical protein
MIRRPCNARRGRILVRVTQDGAERGMRVICVALAAVDGGTLMKVRGSAIDARVLAFSTISSQF